MLTIKIIITLIMIVSGFGFGAFYFFRQYCIFETACQTFEIVYRCLCKLPKHFIVTASVKANDTLLRGMKKRIPSLQTNLNSKLVRH